MNKNNLFLLFAKNFLSEKSFEPLISDFQDKQIDIYHRALLFNKAIIEALHGLVNHKLQLENKTFEKISDIFYPELLIEIYKHEKIPDTEKLHVIFYCRTLFGFNEYLNRIEEITREHHGYYTLVTCGRLGQKHNVEYIEDLYNEWYCDYEKQKLISQSSTEYAKPQQKRI